MTHLTRNKKNEAEAARVVLPMKKLLNEKEVAELYGLSVKTLQAWRFQSRGPNYLKILGRAVRYDPDVLDAYFASQTVKTQG